MLASRFVRQLGCLLSICGAGEHDSRSFTRDNDGIGSRRAAEQHSCDELLVRADVSARGFPLASNVVQLDYIMPESSIDMMEMLKNCRFLQTFLFSTACWWCSNGLSIEAPLCFDGAVFSKAGEKTAVAAN
jgi:hypothetical protein